MTDRGVVLVPTYNERGSVLTVVEQLLSTSTFDVWVLDSESPDGTADAVRADYSDDRRVSVLDLGPKRGLGSAYRAGYAKALDAGYDVIAQLDADQSHDPKLIAPMVALLRRADMVVASRWIVGGGARGWSALRQGLSRFGSRYAGCCLRYPLGDWTTGYAALRRQAALEIDIPSFRSQGYAFQVELKYRAVRAGFHLIEIPMVFTERQGGTSKMSWQIAMEAMVRVPLLRLRK